MTIRQLIVTGDSLSAGAVGATLISEGGSGCWPELVADKLGNIAGIGPLLSSGARFVALGDMFGEDAEWVYTGTWTEVASTAWDKLPYGYGRTASGSSNIATYTLPRLSRSVVGFAIYWVDYTSGGNWSYRIDGGAWTNMAQTLANDNVLCKFYVSGTVKSTVEIRAANAAGTSVGCFPAAIEMFYSTATDGIIVHNLAITGERLNDLVNYSTGDHMAFWDSVRLGTGSPIDNEPNGGTIMLHLNDVNIDNAATWATDLTTFHTRVSPLGPVGFMSPWECNPDGYNVTDQATYRAQTKTTAATLGVPVLDMYDEWQHAGFGPAADSFGNVFTGSDGVDSSTFVGNGELFLLDVTDFPNSGWVEVTGTEFTLISYTSKDAVAASLKGCTTIENGTAMALGEPVYSSQNVYIRENGPVNFLWDRTHPGQTGEYDIANRAYWFIRNRLLNLTSGVPTVLPVNAASTALAVTGSTASVSDAYTAGLPIGAN